MNTKYPYLTNEEFKTRLKAILGIPETLKGAKHADACLVRGNSDAILNRPKMNADPTKPTGDPQ